MYIAVSPGEASLGSWVIHPPDVECLHPAVQCSVKTQDSDPHMGERS